MLAEKRYAYEIFRTPYSMKRQHGRLRWGARRGAKGGGGDMTGKSDDKSKKR